MIDVLAWTYAMLQGVAPLQPSVHGLHSKSGLASTSGKQTHQLALASAEARTMLVQAVFVLTPIVGTNWWVCLFAQSDILMSWHCVPY